MNYVTENITPAKAQEYLNSSQGNRPISKVTVRSYADTMKKGKWMMNGVPVVFDVDGHLLDGHHRLEAVTLAGIPVKMDVCRGVSPDAFTTFDCGRHRNVGQLLAMQGVKNYNTVGSIVVCNETLVRFGRVWANNNARDDHKRTNTEAYDLYMRDPDGFNLVGEDVTRLICKARILKGSTLGGMIYYLSHSGGYSRDYVLRFFECLCTLEDMTVQPAIILRNRIIRERMSNAEIKTSHLFALIVKAWNAYVEGKDMKNLQFNADKEQYPKLILNT